MPKTNRTTVSNFLTRTHETDRTLQRACPMQVWHRCTQTDRAYQEAACRYNNLWRIVLSYLRLYQSSNRVYRKVTCILSNFEISPWDSNPWDDPWNVPIESYSCPHLFSPPISRSHSTYARSPCCVLPPQHACPSRSRRTPYVSRRCKNICSDGYTQFSTPSLVEWGQVFFFSLSSSGQSFGPWYRRRHSVCVQLVPLIDGRPLIRRSLVIASVFGTLDWTSGHGC